MIQWKRQVILRRILWMRSKNKETGMAAILIVEDEEKIARFVELELQHEGY